MPDPDAGRPVRPGETVEVAEQAVSQGGHGVDRSVGRDVRIHVEGVMPLVEREAAVDWDRATGRRSRSRRSDRDVRSDDLGIALGGYRATNTTGSEHGTWVRAGNGMSPGGGGSCSRRKQERGITRLSHCLYCAV